jgi:hypothetical protein
VRLQKHHNGVNKGCIVNSDVRAALKKKLSAEVFPHSAENWVPLRSQPIIAQSQLPSVLAKPRLYLLPPVSAGTLRDLENTSGNTNGCYLTRFFFALVNRECQEFSVIPHSSICNLQHIA